jgi:Ca2+-transporting ATPase
VTIRSAVEELAKRGTRVLGVAHAEVSEGPLPETARGYALQWAGLVGLADPLCPEVPAAIAECRAAGIRVVMITGDYAATAQAIARSAGLMAVSVVTGPELSRLSDVELAERLAAVGVFARILPEQKLRIVQALQADGEVVAMTGDGVNDAPSLKQANIGVAMGGRGTDVAARPHRSSCSTTISPRSCALCGWAGESTTISARRWAISLLCTCRSPALHCFRC